MKQVLWISGGFVLVVFSLCCLVLAESGNVFETFFSASTLREVGITLVFLLALLGAAVGIRRMGESIQARFGLWRK